jgi:hypothetical protein
MAEQPAMSRAELLAQLRASKIGDRACPWCQAVAWDAGETAVITLSDDLGNIHFTKDGLPEKSRLAALFTCTACDYILTFRLGYVVIPTTPKPKRRGAKS